MYLAAKFPERTGSYNKRRLGDLSDAVMVWKPATGIYDSVQSSQYIYTVELKNIRFNELKEERRESGDYDPFAYNRASVEAEIDEQVEREFKDPKFVKEFMDKYPNLESAPKKIRLC